MNGQPRGGGARMLPSLFDRLITQSPSLEVPVIDSADETAAEEGEVLEEGVQVSEHRDSVFRDLEWLFNANSPLGLMEPEFLKRYPHVASSVLNFGLRQIFGRVVHDLTDIDREVTNALARFEPRLRVEHQALQVSEQGHLVEIEIQGTLLTRHSSRRLWIRTDLENMFSKIKLDPHG